MMPHGWTYFDGKGSCIYCGAGDTKLTKEHIVPLSLGGQHVMRDASCGGCANITKKFEQKVARDLWGDARKAFDAPSRRKKERPKSLEMPHPDKRGEITCIPTDEFPGVFVFYKMGKAGILENLPETLDISGNWQLVAIDDERRREAFRDKYPHEPTFGFRHVPHEFGQLLAKIGYGHILTMLDPRDFRSICLPYITGEKENVSFVVGGTLDEQEPEPFGYHLGAGGFGTKDQMMLMSIIRLYANTHAPVYHVAVGDVHGADKAEKVILKMGGEVPVELFSLGSEINQYHWMPRSLPLTFWN